MSLPVLRPITSITFGLGPILIAFIACEKFCAGGLALPAKQAVWCVESRAVASNVRDLSSPVLHLLVRSNNTHPPRPFYSTELLFVRAAAAVGHSRCLAPRHAPHPIRRTLHPLILGCELLVIPQYTHTMESLTNDTATAFQSPLADAQFNFAASSSIISAIASRYLQQVNGWTIALTLLLCAITYDQCKTTTPRYTI
jgi:hypothetical protein